MPCAPVARRALAGLALLGSVLAACGSEGRSEGSPATSSSVASYAGAVTGSDAFVGAVMNRDDGSVLAYVCDGKTVAAWFKGNAAEHGGVTLTSADGARLSGRIEGGTLAGTVAMPGDATPREFRAGVVDPPAGLYRARGQVRGEPAVGGWVVLADGRQRGAVRTSTGFTSSDTDFARPNKPVTSFTSNESDF